MFQQKMQEEEENRFCIYRNKTFNRRKIMIIFVAVLLLMVFLMGRLVYLMIFCSEYYGVRAENLHERERDIKAARGNIYDRNGVVLAENKTVCTISVIHSQIEDPEKVIAVLTKELGMSEETVRKRVEKVSSIERIKTNVEKETGDAIRSYELAGVKIDEDYKRYYPYNELASKVIGFTGGDNQGIIGIEVKYDEYLEGINGKILTLTDARGVEIKNAGERRSEPVEGDDLYLSLDYNIQMYAAQAAVKVREEKQADSVSILVMNPQNGEILAMVNEPEFNLNEPFALNTENDTELSEEEKQDALNKMWRNQCINDTYEPGSTFKIITASAALEEGKVSLSDQFNCPGYKIVEDRRIRCHKVGGHGAEDFTHGIMNSCNPVFIEIGLRIGSDRFCDYFEQFGLLSRTNIDLPGEASTTMRYLLEKVVSEGSGKNAALEGFSIGGKTATSQTLPRSEKRYISSFLGFAPADDPQVLALIIINNPQGVYYGGTIAAPVCRDLFSNILPYLGIEQALVTEDAEIQENP